MTRYECFIEAVSPSAETKAAYMSEFSFYVPGHDGPVFVPWTTIKQIMNAIDIRAQETYEKQNKRAKDGQS